jgi:hypothetical protein
VPTKAEELEQKIKERRHKQADTAREIINCMEHTDDQGECVKCDYYAQCVKTLIIYFE